MPSFILASHSRAAARERARPLVLGSTVVAVLLVVSRLGLAAGIRAPLAETDRRERGGSVSPPQEPSLAQTATAERKQRLDKLAANAWHLARQRALSLYRVVRLRDAALGGGESGMNDIPPAAAVSVGVAALARDLEEARALSAETRRFGARDQHRDQDRVDAHPAEARSADAHSVDAHSVDVGAGRVPGSLRGGGASCVVPQTASGLTLAGGPPRLRMRLARGAPLLAPLGGELRPLGLDLDGRPVSAIAGRDGWTVLLSGGQLDPVAWVKVGERLSGHRPGRSVDGAAEQDVATWDMELWHDLTPVDPRTVCRRLAR